MQNVCSKQILFMNYKSGCLFNDGKFNSNKLN